MKKLLQGVKTEEWLVFLAVGAVVYAIVSSSNKGNTRTASAKVDKNKNYIIGDSQTLYFDWGSEKASLIGKDGTKGAEKYLWEGGKDLKWLKGALEKYPVTPDVNSITINIGTNGNFNQNEDVAGLVALVKQKFPNAQLLAVQGSWKWSPYNQNVTEAQVKAYYKKFKDLGVEVIEPPIGAVEPHNYLPIYKTIGANLDKAIRS
jgi:hypothetical protein